MDFERLDWNMGFGKELHNKLLKLFYHLKPLFPRPLQIWCRKRLVRFKRKKFESIWPINTNTATKPICFAGWPEGKHFAFVLTHDVEGQKGHDRVEELMKLEMELGFHAGYYFVPERYSVSAELRHRLSENGFEVGVHGLKHDGKLYQSRRVFTKRSQKINRYLREWQGVGFRSPAMHHRLDWLHDLDIEYDLSTFDTDPFEPQADAAQTIFPFMVFCRNNCNFFVEIPYTLPQDFSLFVIHEEKNIDIWKRKLDWLALQRGVALVNTHPDYMHFPGRKPRREEYPLQFYLEFLCYARDRYDGLFWNPLPRELARFWKQQCQLITSEDGLCRNQQVY